MAGFSNRGGVDIFAPGVNISCVDKTGRVVAVTGTSASAAAVAGITSLGAALTTLAGFTSDA